MKSLAQEEAHPLRCGICQNTIHDPSSIYQSKLLFIPICERCQALFPEDDRELILNMFLAYGGYFGQHPKDTFSITNTFKILGEQGQMTKDTIDEINIRVLHTALIHGFTPEEYISKLEELLLI